MGAFAKRFPTMLPASQPNNEIENEAKEKTALNHVKILPGFTETSCCTRDNNPGGLRNVFKKGLSWEIWCLHTQAKYFTRRFNLTPRNVNLTPNNSSIHLKTCLIELFNIHRWASRRKMMSRCERTLEDYAMLSVGTNGFFVPLFRFPMSFNTFLPRMPFRSKSQLCQSAEHKLRLVRLKWLMLNPADSSVSIVFVRRFF